MFAVNSAAFQNLSETNHQIGQNMVKSISAFENQIHNLTNMMQSKAAVVPP